MSFRENNLTYYNRLHKQLERKKVKPKNCTKCGRDDLQIEWSNISGQYKNIDDFEALCKSCHQIYDVYELGKKVKGGKAVENVRSIIRPIAIAEAVVKPTIAIDDKEIDFNLEQFKHLIDPSWKAWHAKWIKTHSLDLWVKNAKVAEQDGKDKARYFTFLLKKA